MGLSIRASRANAFKSTHLSPRIFKSALMRTTERLNTADLVSALPLHLPVILGRGLIPL